MLKNVILSLNNFGEIKRRIWFNNLVVYFHVAIHMLSTILTGYSILYKYYNDTIFLQMVSWLLSSMCSYYL